MRSLPARLPACVGDPPHEVWLPAPLASFQHLPVAQITPANHPLPRCTAAGVNRSATHLSLLALYALGGHLVNARLLPVGVLVTSIGFTFSLVFATQVGWVGVGCKL